MSRHRTHRQALTDRLQRALDNLYHNATPTYPALQNAYEHHVFQRWFNDHATFEIQYIQDGGAYGGVDYLGLVDRKIHEGRRLVYAHRYAAKALRDMREERARCNALDSRKALTNALWEEISHYGTLYTWGRGGRTLAPDRLIRRCGGSSFCIRTAEEIAADMPYDSRVRLTLVVESFNRYVKDWCASIPEQWEEATSANGWQADIDAHEGQHPYLVTVWR